MKNNIMNIRYVCFFLLFSISLGILFSCDEDFLNEFPKDKLSEGTFWKTENDALMALTGCYETTARIWAKELSGWSVSLTSIEQWTDIARHKQPMNWAIGTDYRPTSWRLNKRWETNYIKIARCNYFLENIDKVDMSVDTKAEMTAEVRFLRAYCYFLLYQVYGDVPLVTTTQNVDEANQVSRSDRNNVVEFVLGELDQAIPDLPQKRPSSEKGRIEKGAAMAIKGRVLMGEERWSLAAETYKQIIDMGRYIIDPRFKKLFEDEGDNSEEIIWAFQYIQDVYGEEVTQQYYLTAWYGGYNEMHIFQNFIDCFLMNDGKSIQESPIYDPEHPFENRDPRLYATVFLPHYTKFRGKIFEGHPDSLAKIGGAYAGNTGYALKKFEDEDNTGDVWTYGGDFKVIRYAEVLLSYLECKIESGDVITQDLLDITINKLRSREEVNLPPVTELDANKLTEILRRERCVELAFEGIRYWDLVRWRIADEAINRKFYGMKITDNPETYTGKYTIDENGYLFSCEKKWDFEGHNYLWPIPLTELDINKNLTQNEGY